MRGIRKGRCQDGNVGMAQIKQGLTGQLGYNVTKKQTLIHECISLLSCHNQINNTSQAGWLKQQKLLFPQF